MRRFVPLIGLCVATILTAACSSTLPRSGRSLPVNVRITCTGDSVNASISPYVAMVPDSDAVAWTLVESPNVSEIEIDRKGSFSAWPFKERPVRGNAQNPATARDMKAGLVGRKFSYNISATCTPPNKEPRRIVIDPDMIIIRRPQSQ